MTQFAAGAKPVPVESETQNRLSIPRKMRSSLPLPVRSAKKTWPVTKAPPSDVHICGVVKLVPVESETQKLLLRSRKIRSSLPLPVRSAKETWSSTYGPFCCSFDSNHGVAEL